MPVPAPDLPQVLLTLPDGQRIRAGLRAWTWTHRSWMFCVAIPMWSGTKNDWVEPADYVVWVPAEHVEPIEGIDYSAVPTEGTGPPSDAAPAAPEADMRWAWTVERVWEAGPGSRPIGTIVHEYGCAKAPPGGPELTLDEALTALARAGARACKACGAAEVLTRI